MTRAVLTTSSSGLDYYNKPHDIELIRLHLNINGQEYIDGETITRDQLHQFMVDNPETLVQTSSATRTEIANIFDKLYQNGCDEVFIICLSSELSDSFKIIKQVSYAFREKMRFFVYDCKDMNVCEAMIALEADLLTKQNLSFNEIVTQLNKIRENHQMLFSVRNTNHIAKDDQLAPAKSALSTLFDVKPILSISKEGEIVTVDRVRHRDKSFKYIIDNFAPLVKRTKCFPYVLTSSNDHLTEQFIELAKDRLQLRDIPVFNVSTVSMANFGPDAIGLGAFSYTIPQAIKNTKD